MPMLAAMSKQKLTTITMRPTKTVNQYYHKLYQLWEHADTPINERINKFKLTLKLLVLNALLAIKYTSI